MADRWPQVVAPEALAVVRRGAEIQGRSISGFVASARKVHTTVTAVGTLLGHAIVEIDYYFNEDLDSEFTLGMKSIVVETGSDRFQEIFLTAPATSLATIYPTEIIGEQGLVVSKFDDGGNNGAIFSVIFAIRRDGAAELNFEPVIDAAAKALPKGKNLWLPTSTFDLPAGKWHSYTIDDGLGKIGCCAGAVTVNFRIDDTGHVIPSEANFDPTARPF